MDTTNTTFENQLKPLLSNVAQQIVDLVRASVLETVTSGFVGIDVATPGIPSKPSVPAPKPKRVRRSKAELTALENDIVALLAKEPGLKIGRVCEKLGLSEEKTKVGHSLTRLQEQGRVTKNGTRNTAKYSAAAAA